MRYSRYHKLYMSEFLIKHIRKCMTWTEWAKWNVLRRFLNKKLTFTMNCPKCDEVSLAVIMSEDFDCRCIRCKGDYTISPVNPESFT